MSIVSDLAQRLNAIPEGDGTVLDNTVMVMVNGMHAGDHSNHAIPIVMIGSGGGTCRTNGYVALATGGTDLGLSVADAGVRSLEPPASVQ